MLVLQSRGQNVILVEIWWSHDLSVELKKSAFGINFGALEVLELKMLSRRLNQSLQDLNIGSCSLLWYKTFRVKRLCHNISWRIVTYLLWGFFYFHYLSTKHLKWYFQKNSSRSDEGARDTKKKVYYQKKIFFHIY